MCSPPPTVPPHLPPPPIVVVVIIIIIIIIIGVSREFGVRAYGAAWPYRSSSQRMNISLSNIVFHMYHIKTNV